MSEKKAISTNVKVQYGGKQDLLEVADLLEKLAASLKENGNIGFLVGDHHVEITPNKVIQVEYEYEVEEDEHSFEIELKWKGEELDSKNIIK